MRDPMQHIVRRDNAPRLEQGLTKLELSLAGSLHPLRVLVADDDQTTGDLLAAITKRPGYEVVSVSDGRQAYRLLKSDCNFQVAVFNVTMPHLKGVDMARHMKTEKRLMRIPVVVVGGDHDLKTVSECFAAGAIAFLPKPLDLNLLQRTLRIAMDGGVCRKEIQQAA